MITTTSPLASAATAGAATDGSSGKSASATADQQDRFLKLLVTQLKNQDPLNPLDNAQITSQMAQISTVEGINNLKASIESLLASVQSTSGTESASLLGRRVAVPGSSINLNSGTAVAAFELSSPADSVTVTVKGASGEVLHTALLGASPAGMQAIVWDGTTDSGAKAADGVYRFEISALSTSGSVPATTYSVERVQSVSPGTDGVRLGLPAAGSVALKDVKQFLE